MKCYKVELPTTNCAKNTYYHTQSAEYIDVTYPGQIWVVGSSLERVAAQFPDAIAITLAGHGICGVAEAHGGQLWP